MDLKKCVDKKLCRLSTPLNLSTNNKVIDRLDQTDE